MKSYLNIGSKDTKASQVMQRQWKISLLEHLLFCLNTVYKVEAKIHIVRNELKTIVQELAETWIVTSIGNLI